MNRQVDTMIFPTRGAIALATVARIGTWGPVSLLGAVCVYGAHSTLVVLTVEFDQLEVTTLARSNKEAFFSSVFCDFLWNWHTGSEGKSNPAKMVGKKKKFKAVKLFLRRIENSVDSKHASL